VSRPHAAAHYRRFGACRQRLPPISEALRVATPVREVFRIAYPQNIADGTPPIGGMFVAEATRSGVATAVFSFLKACVSNSPAIVDRPEEFVSAPEAARILGVSQTTGWLWCKSGKLAAKFVAGRYLVRRKDVLKLHRSREIDALQEELDEITGKPRILKRKLERANSVRNSPPRIHSKKPPQRKTLQGLHLISRGDWI
jgi:hypothetical protein